MKLVLQIAAGIILAGSIISGVSIGVAAYSLSVANEKTVEIQKQQQFRVQQQALQNEALKQEQIKRVQQAQQKRIETIKIQSERRVKFNAAWEIFYEVSYQCKHPSSQSDITWCKNYEIEEKKEFKRLVSLGKIKVK